MLEVEELRIFVELGLTKGGHEGLLQSRITFSFRGFTDKGLHLFMLSEIQGLYDVGEFRGVLLDPPDQELAVGPVEPGLGVFSPETA